LLPENGLTLKVRCVALLLIGAVLQGGCALPGSARGGSTAPLAGQYVYEKPLSEVWPQARAILREEGYSLDESPDTFAMVTAWRDVGAKGATRRWIRYLVVGEPIDGDHCIVRFVRAQIQQPSAGGIEPRGSEPASRLLLPVAIKLRQRSRGMSASSDLTEVGGRDLSMELKLLRRVAPDVAERVEMEAEGPEGMATFLGGPLLTP
jgi:hypothetical protein